MVHLVTTQLLLKDFKIGKSEKKKKKVNENSTKAFHGCGGGGGGGIQLYLHLLVGIFVDGYINPIDLIL